jgi:uncharacterized protein
LGKIFGYFLYEFKLLQAALKFRPDVFIGHSSFYSAHIAFLLGRKHISLEDTGNMEQVRLYLPFTDVVLTSTSFKKNLGRKQLFYDGYHELAYLHPNRFKPDKEILKCIGIKEDGKYAVLRFVSRKSSHDMGLRVISVDMKREIVKRFSEHIRVFISSEEALPEDLEGYRLKIDPWKMHDVMHYAELYIGDSATMASEAAIMGVPAVFLDDRGRFYTDEEEKKYGLVYHYTLSDDEIRIALEKAIELTGCSDLSTSAEAEPMHKIDKSSLVDLHLRSDLSTLAGQESEHKVDKPGHQNSLLKVDLADSRNRLLADHIDVTAFLVWFTLEFPKSRIIVKENPEYLLRFR